MKKFKTFVMELHVDSNMDLRVMNISNEQQMLHLEAAEEKLLKFLTERKREIFPHERKEVLTHVTRMLHSCHPNEKIPPRIVAQTAMLLANFRKHPTKEGYLTEDKLSRMVQKLLKAAEEER